MRISDWSSDVCSSDLACATLRGQSECGHQSNDKQHADYCPIQAYNHLDHNFPFAGKHIHQAAFPQLAANEDRKSVVWGKSVSVRVDLGGRRIIKKKNTQTTDRMNSYQHTIQNNKKT